MSTACRSIHRVSSQLGMYAPNPDQGEWHAQGWIIASTVTDGHEQDPSQVPALLAQVDRELDRFIGDGIYDREPVYAAVEAHSPGARVIIPPAGKDAAVRSQAATSPTQRDRHLLAIERVGRFDWKRTSVYDDQSHAENAFSR